MTAGSAFSVAVVCEADADQRIACDLAERVLLDKLDWLEQGTIGEIGPVARSRSQPEIPHRLCDSSRSTILRMPCS